jgi:hypothetical protein
MSNDLFKISLNQGKQFNNYQTKIIKNMSNTAPRKRTIKEGFVSSEQEMMLRPADQGYVSVIRKQEQGSNLNNQVNQKDLDDLKQMQSRYSDLIQQYTSIQKSIGDSSLDTISRVSSNNPYLNKVIQLQGGALYYVTNQGVAKQILDMDIYAQISGKNGFPPQGQFVTVPIPWNDSYQKQGTMLPTNPPLIIGMPVKIGESVGNEGKNVYASSLINNVSSEYIGCYNDKPPSTNVNVVPVMNSSNNVNGFVSIASSMYMGNNDTAGPWLAFDQNPNTVWHSEVSSATNYNEATGVYEGSNGLPIADIGTMSGEFLQINMPGINTNSAQNITVTQYSLSPRLDAITTRSPNSWYVIGYKDNQWIRVDRQINQQFTNGSPKVYNVSSPGAYSAYALLVDKVGNDDQTFNRYCVQVAEWNLYSNSDYTMTNDKRAMIWNPDAIGGYTSFDNCQQYAVDNGYQYFGMQDYMQDGTAACLVSNDISRTQIYGDASKQTTIVPMWSTNTTGSSATNATLSVRGRLSLTDNIWQSSDKDPSNCGIQYSISEKTDAPGNDLSHYTNTTVENCQSACTENSQCYGFSMNTDTNNECWLKSQFQSINSNESRSIYQKVQSDATNCKFLLMLQDDGNMSIYQGTPDNIIQPAVWSTMTNGKQLQANSDWEASKGSYGRNYIIGGEVLSINQWIGSTNGSTKLMMQQDGNLVLYTSESKSGCVKGQNDKTYGSTWVNAVYKLGSAGNVSSLGKIGYVDADSNLKEYPDSMLGFSNDYQIYQNTDSAGNDITSLTTTDQNGCQTACNNNADCAAYVYQGSTSTCWLKNRSAYPKGKKQSNNTTILGVRNPQLKGSNTCSNEIVNVDTIQYDNYLKGTAMTTDTQCNQPIVSQEDMVKFDNIKSQLVTLGQDITSKMETLYNEDNKIYEKLNMNEKQFKKDLEKYRTLNIKIRKEFELQSNNNIEGMQNFKGSLNMNDINGMLSDSDLIVLQGNYSYIMWSILAVGLLTITVNTMKK